MRVKVWLIGFVLAAAELPAVAQSVTGTAVRIDASRLAAARKLFTLLQAGDQSRKTIEQVFGSASDAMIKQMLSKTNSKDPNFGERQRRFAVVRKDAMINMLKDVMPQMIEEMIQVYARTFTVAELNAATDFYGSPAGQAFLNKRPMVMHEVMQTVIPKIMPRVQQYAADLKTKMQSAVADLPAPPAN